MSNVHKDTAREAGRLREERRPLEETAAQKARSMGHTIQEKAHHAAEIIEEKTHQAKDTVGEAVEYLKEHLPKVTVSHEEPTPEEKWQDELMEESIELAKQGGGEGKDKEEVTTPILCPPALSKGNSNDGNNDANPYPPKTATEVINKTTDVEGEAKNKATHIINQTPDTPTISSSSISSGRREDRRGRDLSGAPDELFPAEGSAGTGEDVSAKGAMAALAGKVKHAGEYVRAHMPGEHHHQHHRDTVHEYRELPGHIHPLLVKEGVKKAVQEKVLHRQPEESKDQSAAAAPKIRDPKEAQEPWLGIPVPPSSTTTTAPSNVDVSNAGNEEALNAASVYNTAGMERESQAVEPAKDAASSAPGGGGGGGDTFHSVTRRVSELVDEAETKAKSAYDHTKEMFREGASELEKEIKMEGPKSAEEERLAAGEIPKSTEEVLRERGMGGDV